MRIKFAIDKVREEHLNDLRRRYPLVDAVDRGWTQPLSQDRDELMIDPERYPLIQDPLIECIPRYKREKIGEIPKLKDSDGHWKYTPDEVEQKISQYVKSLLEDEELNEEFNFDQKQQQYLEETFGTICRFSVVGRYTRTN